MREFTEIIDFPEKLHEAYKIKIGRKGEKKTSGGGKDFRLPTKDDHFEIRLNERDANGDLKVARDIMAKLVQYNADRKGLKNIDPDNPKNYGIVTEIPIRLLYDDISSNFSYKYAFHKGRKIICHGNGKEAEWHPGQEDQKDIVHPEGQSCNDCKYYQAKNCKYSCRLICYLEFMPELGSVAVFRSTGFNTVRNIKTSLKTIKRLGNGILAGLPLVLTVSPKEGTYDDGGRDKTTTVYVVNIVFRPPPAKQIKGKTPILEIGTEVAKEAFNIANVRETNKQEWEKMKASAEEVKVSIVEDEDDEQSLADHEEEFYPENVVEEIAEENEQRVVDEEKSKNALLDAAKKRMLKAGKGIKAVNQGLAAMRSKSLDDLKAWFKKTFKTDPETLMVSKESESPEAPPESAPAAPVEEKPKPKAISAVEPETDESTPEPLEELPPVPGEEELPPVTGEEAEPQVKEAASTDDDGQTNLF